MARGRKPIDRSEEEAKAIRKEQIRRNVRAYRQRQKVPAEEATAGEARLGQWTFVQEGVSCDIPCNQTVSVEQSTAIKLQEVKLGAPVISKPDEQSSVKRPWDLNIQGTLHALNTKQGVGTSMKLAELLPPSINGAIVSRQQFVSNSARIFLPSESGDTGPHWAQTVPFLIHQCEILDNAVSALSLLQIACTRKEKRIKEASRSCYGQALKALSTTLSRSPRFCHGGVFSTAQVLATYELFNGTLDGVGTGWNHHIKGALAHLEKFPSLHVLDNQQSFHFLETLCVFNAIRSRRGSPFAQSQWWDMSLNKFGGDTYGPLLRLMALLPPLMEQTDRLTSSLPDSGFLKVIQSVLVRVFDLVEQFDKWRAQSAAIVPDFRYNEMFPDDAVASSTEIEKSDISFPNLYVCRLHLMYWSSIVTLHDIICDLAKALHRSTSSLEITSISLSSLLDDDLGIYGLKKRVRGFAVMIRRATSYCLQPEQGIVGKSILLLPIWLAANYFKSYSPEDFDYCRQVLRELGLVPWQYRT